MGWCATFLDLSRPRQTDRDTRQVPQSLYPDSFNAENSSIMATLITSKLREDALELRRLASQSPDAKRSLGAVKEKMMRDIHRILTIMLGPPPNPDKEMTWEYYDKDDKFHSLTTTPLKFANELSSKASISANSGTNIHELFSLVNDPRNEYMQLLSVSRLGNIIDMRPVRYVNVDMMVSPSQVISQILVAHINCCFRRLKRRAYLCSALTSPSSSVQVKQLPRVNAS